MSGVFRNIRNQNLIIVNSYDELLLQVVNDGTVASIGEDTALWVYDGAANTWKLSGVDTALGTYTNDGNGEISSTNTIKEAIEILDETKQQYLSYGIIVKPTYLDNGDGSVTLGDGEYTLASQIDGCCLIKKYKISGGTFVLNANSNNYIVADYNNGTPIIKNTTDLDSITETTIIPVLTIYRNGMNILHVIDWKDLGNALSNKLHQSIVKTDRYRRESGLVLSESATRIVNVSEGRVWVGANRIDTLAFNSSTHLMKFHYHIGGEWNESIITQYNNTQYDDGTDLQTLTTNKYAVNFIYRGIESSPFVHIILGSGNYKLIEAQSAQPSIIPTEILKSSAILIGRIIVKANDSTATQIDSAFDTIFSTRSSIEHNDLTNIQGGTTSEYYHSTSLEYTGTGSGVFVRQTSPLLVTPKIGDATNYSTFETDGTLVFNGEATVWNDLIMPTINLRPGNTPPVYAQFIGGIYGFRFDANTGDEVHGAVELQHDYKEGTDLIVHVHWSPTTTNTGNVVFGFEYTFANPMEVFSTPATLTNPPVASSGIINRHHLTNIGTISSATLKIGDIIAFRFYRQNGGTDTFTGNVFVHSIGIHYECDTIGSRNTITK